MMSSDEEDHPFPDDFRWFRHGAPMWVKHGKNGGESQATAIGAPRHENDCWFIQIKWDTRCDELRVLCENCRPMIEEDDEFAPRKSRRISIKPDRLSQTSVKVSSRKRTSPCGSKRSFGETSKEISSSSSTSTSSNSSSNSQPDVIDLLSDSDDEKEADEVNDKSSTPAPKKECLTIGYFCPNENIWKNKKSKDEVESDDGSSKSDAESNLSVKSQEDLGNLNDNDILLDNNPFNLNYEEDVEINQGGDHDCKELLKEIACLRRHLENCPKEIDRSKSRIYNILLNALDTEEEREERECNDLEKADDGEREDESPAYVGINSDSPRKILPRQQRNVDPISKEIIELRSLLTSLQVVSGEQQSDKSGCGIIASRDLSERDSFIDPFTNYRRDEPPEILNNPRGHYMKLSEGYMCLRPSIFEFLNEPRNEKEANAKLLIDYKLSALPTQTKKLKLKLLRPVKMGEEILINYS